MTDLAVGKQKLTIFLLGSLLMFMLVACNSQLNREASHLQQSPSPPSPMPSDTIVLSDTPLPTATTEPKTATVSALLTQAALQTLEPGQTQALTTQLEDTVFIWTEWQNYYSNNKNLISYFYHVHHTSRNAHETTSSLFIYDLETEECELVLREEDSPTFYNDHYQVIWVNDDQQLLFFFPARTEIKDDQGNPDRVSMNRLFLYDLQSRSLEQLAENVYFYDATYFEDINKVILPNIASIEILDLETLSLSTLLEFEIPRSGNRDYFPAPDIVLHPNQDLFYVAVARDVVFDETSWPGSANTFFYEIDPATESVREVTKIEDIAYSYTPPLILANREWLIYFPYRQYFNEDVESLYFVNILTGQVELRNISYEELVSIVETPVTPTPAYDTPWEAACLPEP